MSDSFAVSQTASFIFNTVDTAALSLPLSSVSPVAAILSFHMPSTDIYLVGDVVIRSTFGGTFGSGIGLTSETYRYYIINDPAMHGILVDGILPDEQCPIPVNIFGTTNYTELGHVTFTSQEEYGTVDTTLDSAALTRVMTMTQRSGDTFTTWNGYLVIWVAADQNSFQSGIQLTNSIISDSSITYANRFTGLQGPWQARSRVDECPVCGDRLPRENWGYSPWHKRMVCPACIDPADPYDTPLIIESEDPLGGGED